MNKILIPTILIATVLVAGFFALAPVSEVSTVHTTIQGTQMVIDSLELTDVAITGGTDIYTLNCAGDASILSVTAAFIGTDSTNEELIATTLGGETLQAAGGEGSLSLGNNVVVGEITAAAAADDLATGVGAGTYTDNTLILKATVIHQSDETCIFTETA